MICPHTGGLLTPLDFSEEYAISQEGVVYYLKARSADYGPDYFLDEYKNQYGRTYLEDEQALRKLARKRLDWMKDQFLPGSRVFEIGCAAGFFLDEARKIGCDVSGVEISEYAADYARNNLSLNVTASSFLDAPSDEKYDAVCAFYVLEHFQNQKEFFQKVSDQLKPGGLFLFAIPSTNGPVFKQNPGLWADTHPIDHFADYSPASLKRILPLYNLSFLKARPASYHPERAGLWRHFPFLYRQYSNFFSFGDTIEAAAQKQA